MTVFLLGSTLTGAAFAVGTVLLDSSSRTLAGAAEAAGFGSGLGALLFGSAALALAYRDRLARLLRPYWFEVQWCISMPMGLSLGYLIACIRHHVYDAWSLVALVLVFFGALAKTIFFVVFSKNGESAA